MTPDSASWETLASSEWGLYGTMPRVCEENIRDIGRQVFEIGVDSFFARVLPAVHDTEVTTVLECLRASGTLDQHTDEWVHFKNAGEPKHQSAHESIVFGPIGDLAQEIIRVVHNSDLNKEVQFVYDKRSQSAPKSPKSPNSFQPDGYFVLKTAATDLETFNNLHKPRWRNLTLISEFQKADYAKARNDDVCKTLWGMKRTMGEDLRRRFVYGLTIENTAARLWFSDRSQVIVSSPFNFIVETGRLVRLLYTFIYSNATALGWDDSMTAISSGETKNLTYSIKVGARRFRTFGAQVYGAAVSLMGRNTRVWNAREELDSGGLSKATYVVKDAWTDADRRREGQVYDILDKLPLELDERSSLRQLLLTKVCHADVVVDEALDITLDLSDIKDPYQGFDLVWIGPNHDPESRCTSGTASECLHHQQEELLPPLISRRQMVHNRIVFEEFGTPLRALDSLAQTFRSIGQVALGLHILHKHGWVHRDISTGNILVCRDGTTKLVDFEYAQKYDDRPTPPTRMGTENYMAVEVDYQAYMFRRWRTRTKQKQMAIKPPVTSIWAHLNRSETRMRAFAYNPLHDLESLHWVGINMLADRYIIGVDGGKKRPHTDGHSKLREQHEWARKLFYSPRERLGLLIGRNDFFDFVETLDPRVQPLGRFLQNISTELVDRYTLAEEDLASIDFNVAGDLYTFFKPTAQNNIDLEDFEGVRIARIDYATLEEERNKRRRLIVS